MPSDSMKISYAPRPQNDGRCCSLAVAALVSLMASAPLHKSADAFRTRVSSICIASGPDGILRSLFQEVARTVRIAASPERAWSVLLDFPRVASWLKVVHDLHEVEPKRRYTTMLEDRVGPFAMRADLAIDVRVEDAARTLHVSGSGEDRQIASRISASLDVRVIPQDPGSSVDVKGRYEITGRVATLGAGAIRKKGEKVLEDFFNNLERELSAA